MYSSRDNYKCTALIWFGQALLYVSWDSPELIIIANFREATECLAVL